MHLSRRNVFRGAVVIGAGSVLPTLALATPASAAPTIASCATWGARNPSGRVMRGLHIWMPLQLPETAPWVWIHERPSGRPGPKCG